MFHADGLHTDRRTDRGVDRQGYVRKLIAAFCSSAKAPFNTRRKLCIRKSHLYNCGPVKGNGMSMKMKFFFKFKSKLYPNELWKETLSNSQKKGKQ